MTSRLAPAGFDEVGRLQHVLLRHPRDAFVDQAAIARQWRQLNYLEPPDLDRAVDEFERFSELLENLGVTIRFLNGEPRLGLDSLYVRDAAVVAPGGMISCRMGKPARAAEPAVNGAAFAALGLPVIGGIEGAGRLEGGDVVWLDRRSVVVGEGPRSNAEGIRQLRALLGGEVEVLAIKLPRWQSPADVFHLMSILSPLDRDLALVHAPLLPARLRDRLTGRGIRLVELPETEFDSMGCNVLAVAPRRCLMLAGNPRTRAVLEREGIEVHTYEGTEISIKGGGGPTCLTRPIVRA